MSLALPLAHAPCVAPSLAYLAAIVACVGAAGLLCAGSLRGGSMRIQAVERVKYSDAELQAKKNAMPAHLAALDALKADTQAKVDAEQDA